MLTLTGFITEIQYYPVQRTYKLWQGAQGKHKIAGNQTHLDANVFFVVVFFLPFSFSYNYFTCQSKMFPMWLSFATAFTSAYKSSDSTQKIIQIHDDLPLLTTDL